MSLSFTPLTPHVFLALTVLLATSIEWPRRWIISGAPVLTYVWLLGTANGYRVLPLVPLWTLVSTLNLIYAVAATSWLLYWLFLAGCYPVIFISCAFQFDAVADVLRRRLRSLLRQLHFIEDTIAFFDLPALEIDTEVDGLMFLRGISISLSTFTIVAHGIEVSIKLSDDMELALRTDDVTISLLRKIEIGNVYGNLKGGEFEMTFHTLAEDTHDDQGDPLMVTDTPLLQAAAALEGDKLDMVKMREKLAQGPVTEERSIRDGLKSTNFLYLSDQQAIDKYRETVRWIKDTSAIQRSQRDVEDVASKNQSEDGQRTIKSHQNDVLAATCSSLHAKASITHPPRRSIKVTTLQNLTPTFVRRFLHRLPMLYRLLLNPLSYFHPVQVASVTASASGAWIQSMLNQNVFQHESESSSDTAHLQKRISSWLLDANFVVGLNSISAWAHVPFLPAFNINNRFKVGDVMVYRALAKESDLEQVVRLGGADASVEIPSFLLPHHEHLLPPQPTEAIQKVKQEILGSAEGKPHAVHAQKQLEQTRKDETNMSVSVHACLPIVIHQDLLDFATALIKASKLAAMHDHPSALDKEVHGFKDFSKAVGSSIRDNMRKTTVDAMGNDKWMAKLIGKIIKGLETAQGDVGYSGDVPIALKPYREQAEWITKLLA